MLTVYAEGGEVNLLLLDLEHHQLLLVPQRDSSPVPLALLFFRLLLLFLFLRGLFLLFFFFLLYLLSRLPATFNYCLLCLCHIWIGAVFFFGSISFTTAQ